jgi:hypothetical protein
LAVFRPGIIRRFFESVQPFLFDRWIMGWNNHRNHNPLMTIGGAMTEDPFSPDEIERMKWSEPLIHADFYDDADGWRCLALAGYRVWDSRSTRQPEPFSAIC